MNKRGDLSTALLFVAALVLYGFTLFSFVSFNGSFAEGSEERGGIVSDISFYEGYINAQTKAISGEIISEGGLIRESEGLKEKFREIALNKNLEIEGMENYFGKILRGEFEFNRDEEKYWFEMRGLKIKSQRGASFIERTINLRMEFDYSGDLISLKRG
ncbi:MAG: hypothetical protein Q7S27_04375 [Nanoarchaeota archaeon]|nr:hypothetical protein [Nanoarchaeota archaeon]